jgi:ribokinase
MLPGQQRDMSTVRVAVVGHVEWADLAVVDHFPRAGEIVHASHYWQDAGGGGAISAVQLFKLAGRASFFTALSTDRLGSEAAARLTDAGVEVHSAERSEPQRRAVVHLDAAGERTITVLGPRIVPRGADPLPWEDLSAFDGVYFTGGDEAALRAARAARVLVATPRAAQTLLNAGVELDVLVNSGNDPVESGFDPAAMQPPPRHVVSTLGAEGGRWIAREQSGTWKAAELPGPPVDAYGCGDSFAAGLTYALAARMPMDEAVALAARCGAACLTGRGPYAAQLQLAP